MKLSKHTLNNYSEIVAKQVAILEAEMIALNDRLRIMKAIYDLAREMAKEMKA